MEAAPANVDRDSVLLVVSELVSNAIVHAPGCEVIDLTVDIRGDDAHIEVADTDPRMPVLRRPALDEPSGRGLLMVDSIASRWGWTEEAGDGKRVWCDVEGRPG